MYFQVDNLSWSSIAPALVAIYWINGISSAPLSATDHLQRLQPVERQFYQTYCGAWSFTPHSLVKRSKPGHCVINRIVSAGTKKHCLELMLKLDYPMPDYEEIKPLKESNIPIIWVVGGPGSGKGSVCSKFAEANSLTHISLGNLLRDEVQTTPNAAVGKLLQETMKEGQLVPNFVAMSLLIKKMLSSVGKTKGYLLDGFPRTLDLAILFQNTVRAPDAIVFLDVSEEIMRKRVLTRNQGRADDNEETFNKRLEVFYSESISVITNELFKSKVKKVSSEGTVAETYSLFSAAVNDILKPSN